MKNKYIKRSKISEGKFRQMLKIFSADETASKCAYLVGVNVNTTERVFKLLRERLADLALAESNDALSGEFEVDESYFGARRVRGKRGRGAAGKTPVFGLLKRYDKNTGEAKVYTQVVKNCSKAELMPIIQGKVLEDSTVYSDGWKAYDGLILNGYTHHRVYHSKSEFARGKNHVNGIESYWSYAKRRMNKFNGFNSKTFPIYLKETEYRFNHRQDDIYSILLKKLRNKPLG